MTEVDIRVKLAGFYINWPVMNGAGSCRTIEEVKTLARSNIPIILVGSFTKEEREGNKGETFWYNDWLSLNSRGLPNLGSQVFEKIIPEMAAIAHQAGKLLVVSVAGFTPQEYVLLSKLAFAAGADIVELNLSCPNVWEKGIQKRIACFYPDLVKEILKSIEETIGSEAKIFVKLSPFSDPYLLTQVAEVIKQFKIVKAVVAINTFPNALLFDDNGRPIITTGEGLAGLGGPATKPLALGQVKQLRSLLPESIDIIGVGGISLKNFKKDIRDFQLAGAKAVQFCTLLLEYKPESWPELFTRLASRYIYPDESAS